MARNCPKKRKQQVAAFVDGDEDDVDHQQRAAMDGSLIQEDNVEGRPADERVARHRQPRIFESFEEWEAFGPCFGEAHYDWPWPTRCMEQGGVPRSSG